MDSTYEDPDLLRHPVADRLFLLARLQTTSTRARFKLRIFQVRVHMVKKGNAHGEANKLVTFRRSSSCR